MCSDDSADYKGMSEMDNEETVDWFEWDGELPSDTSTFLQSLRAAARQWTDADPRHAQVYQRADRLVLGLDVPDCARRKVVRNLRIDYGPFGLIHGEDETGQYVTELTPAQDEYGCLAHAGKSPADLGRAAAAWFRREMARPIELLEWQRLFYWYKEYRLTDTGRSLCWSAKNDERRPNLGAPRRAFKVETQHGLR